MLASLSFPQWCDLFIRQTSGQAEEKQAALLYVKDGQLVIKSNENFSEKVCLKLWQLFLVSLFEGGRPDCLMVRDESDNKYFEIMLGFGSYLTNFQ